MKTCSYETLIFGVLLLTLTFAAAASGLAGTIQMDELGVEGEVQKPEVLFIFDRSGGEPPIPGANRLKPNVLGLIIEDAEGLAREQEREDLKR